ncbi:beta-lactamase-like protein [Dactylonectria macrodidyma]|uniref:Beta-lactamase-like protein n=1 Tax=Dactylonectria macrodidyma TaxID=307937 RepID=A0A9P9DSP4_9HYPO|nr:beta-lactamase-like protein [Dactylonectria macrodidyma]
MPAEAIIIHNIFEPKTATWQYIVADPKTKYAVIIDPVLDFDPVKNTLTTESADHLLSVAKEHNFVVVKILETHVHADHITASNYLQLKLSVSQDFRPDICIGKRVGQTQDHFGQRYGIPESEYKGAFDKLFDDDETFSIGDLQAKAIHLPGHTPDHLGYIIGENVFCGDSLFNPDVGSARCDFPGGDASTLYASVRKMLSLPDDFKIWTGHDYPPGGADGRAEPLAATTVSEQNKTNKHLKNEVLEKEFVQWRTQRDAGLATPRLLHQSLQMNIRAGKLPAKSTSGDMLLHLPLHPGWE